MSVQQWQKMRRTYAVTPPGEKFVKRYAQTHGLTLDEAWRSIKKSNEGTEYWVNNLYRAEVRRSDNSAVSISIGKHDGGAIMRDWRHFQQIKNDILGADCECVELYPAEDRTVDIGNRYHLIGSSDPSFRFPFGFKERAVQHVSIKGGPQQREQTIQDQPILDCTLPQP